MSNVRVAVRVRPLTKREEAQGAKVIVGIDRDRLLVTNLKVPVNKEHDSRTRTRQFGFDFCYWSADAKSQHFASQEMIYDDIGSKVLEAVFEGFNACVLAYGQSGSGKTFTMMGQNGQLGLTPRICQGLFERLSKVTDKQLTFRTEVSFLEIYNERVGDLLRPPTFSKQPRRRPTLRVREHPKLGPCVQDLSKHVVNDFNGVQTLIERGLQNRSVAATRMHDHSSRSHAIFTINFIQARLDEDLPSEVVSKIHLVDLAGSERATVGMNKIRLKEGANINKSLVALGSVICALAEKSMSLWSLDSLSSAKSHTSSTGDSFTTSSTSPLGSSHRSQPPFVPYRDSVLTWLLKDSLGGNSKTIMVATISPASTAYNETLSTLRYAQRAKCIVNKPIINEDPNVKLIRELKAEITRLRELLSTTKQNGNLKFNGEHSLPVSEIITRNQDKAQELTRCWIEKWHYFQRQAQETMCDTCSNKANMAGMIDCNTPYLLGSLNLFTDGVQIVCLKDGDTVVTNCSDGHSNTEPADEACLPERLSLLSSDTLKCKLCDTDMLSDLSDEGPILKSLLSDSDESTKSVLKLDENSIVPRNTIELCAIGACSVFDTVTRGDGFDEEIVDDDWSDTDDFTFYAFDDQDLLFEESTSTLTSISDVAIDCDAHSEKPRHSVRYLSPIEECSSSQSQSPVMVPNKLEQEPEMARKTMLHCDKDRVEQFKDIVADVTQCRNSSVDIESDSLDDTESENDSLRVDCSKSALKQHRMMEPLETTLSTKELDSVPKRSRKLSCYHIGFVSSDDISEMDAYEDADILVSKSNVVSVRCRRASLETPRSKKQSYYTVSNRNCGTSSSSEDDTSHSHNSAHTGSTYQSTRQQKFQRIVMENRRKRRHKKTSSKKEAPMRSHVYRETSKPTAKKILQISGKEKYQQKEKTVSPLPLPQPSFYTQQEQPILISLLNENVSDSMLEEVFKVQETTNTFDIMDPPTDPVHIEPKDSSLTLLDCSFTADSLENLSSICPSQNENVVQHPSCWTYVYEKVEPCVHDSTLKKHGRRSAFKHSWPSCDSLTMVYMGPEWGSTETNLVASLQSLDDPDWHSTDMSFASTTRKNNYDRSERNVLKKSFSDGCLPRKWTDVASSSLSVPEVPLDLSETEMCLRHDALKPQCEVLVPDHEAQCVRKDPKEDVNQQTSLKNLLQTIPNTEMTSNEKKTPLIDDVPDCCKNVSRGTGASQNKEPWNNQQRFVGGVWMPLSTFYRNNYQADHLDENQDDQLSFCEISSDKTEKESGCDFRVVSTKTESSSDSGFLTEVNTVPLENASSQTPKVTRECFSQTSKLLSDNCVQTDPICLMMSTQTEPLRTDSTSQTECRVSECTQTVQLCEQQDGFSQTDNASCKDACMQVSFGTSTVGDADTATVGEANVVTISGADQNEFINTLGNSINSIQNDPVGHLVTDTNLCMSGGGKPASETHKLNDLKACESGIYIGFHGNHHEVQSLSFRFNHTKSKCSSSDEVECRTDGITVLSRRKATDREESPVCNQVTSSLDNFQNEKELKDIDCNVSDYSNDVTVSYPHGSLVVSPSASSLNQQDRNDSMTPVIMDDDSCNEDDRVDEERKSFSDEQQQQQECDKPVLDVFECSYSTCSLKDKQEKDEMLEELSTVSGSTKCCGTSETSCATFTQTDFNDIFQMNTHLKAFLYSSLGFGGTEQLDLPKFDIFTEMESRMKALELQCSEILMEQQRCSTEYEKYFKKKTVTERSRRKKTVEWREKHKMISDGKKKHVREIDGDSDEDYYYELPNTLKLNCNYLHKRKKFCRKEISKENMETVVLKTDSVNELPSLAESSAICPDGSKFSSEETLKTIDPMLKLSGVSVDICEPVAEEVEDIFLGTEASTEVPTLECHLQTTPKPCLEQEDSEEDYGSNLPEDILVLLRECKAVRKKAWVEINLAHQQLGY